MGEEWESFIREVFINCGYVNEDFDDIASCLHEKLMADEPIDEKVDMFDDADEGGVVVPESPLELELMDRRYSLFKKYEYFMCDIED